MMTFNEVLIRAVFNRPAIWNPNHKFHKDRNVVFSSWEEISSEMAFDCDTLKQKWKSLRDYYRTELKKTNKATGLSRGSKWPYFKMMSFLNTVKDSSPPFQKLVSNPPDYFDGDSSRAESPENLKGEPCRSDPEEEEEVETETLTKAEAQNLMRIETAGRIYQQQHSQSGKTKRSEDNMMAYMEKALEFKAKKLKLLELDKEDEDILFFKSLLPDFKSLPRNKRMLLKLKFQETLYNELREAELFPDISITAQGPKIVEFPSYDSEVPEPQVVIKTENVSD